MPYTRYSTLTSKQYWTDDNTISHKDPFNMPKKRMIKCTICGKILRGKKYYIRGKWGTSIVCSNCKFLYGVFRKEIYDNKNLQTLIKINDNLNYDYRKGFIYKTKQIKNSATKLKNCRMCRKRIPNNYIYIKMRFFNAFICRNCEYLFKLMVREKGCKNPSNINAIIDILRFLWSCNIQIKREYR